MTINERLPQKTRIEETNAGHHDPHECCGTQYPGNVPHIVDHGGAIWIVHYEVPRCTHRDIRPPGVEIQQVLLTGIVCEVGHPSLVSVKGKEGVWDR